MHKYKKIWFQISLKEEIKIKGLLLLQSRIDNKITVNTWWTQQRIISMQKYTVKIKHTVLTKMFQYWRNSTGRLVQEGSSTIQSQPWWVRMRRWQCGWGAVLTLGLFRASGTVPKYWDCPCRLLGLWDSEITPLALEIWVLGTVLTSWDVKTNKNTMKFLLKEGVHTPAVIIFHLV